MLRHSTGRQCRESKWAPSYEAFPDYGVIYRLITPQEIAYYHHYYLIEVQMGF
jgi:hypothetical protein